MASIEVDRDGWDGMDIMFSLMSTDIFLCIGDVVDGAKQRPAGCRDRILQHCHEII
jgi:hypothetical protein